MDLSTIFDEIECLVGELAGRGDDAAAVRGAGGVLRSTFKCEAHALAAQAVRLAVADECAHRPRAALACGALARALRAAVAAADDKSMRRLARDALPLVERARTACGGADAHGIDVWASDSESDDDDDETSDDRAFIDDDAPLCVETRRARALAADDELTLAAFDDAVVDEYERVRHTDTFGAFKRRVRAARRAVERALDALLDEREPTRKRRRTSPTDPIDLTSDNDDDCARIERARAALVEFDAAMMVLDEHVGECASMRQVESVRVDVFRGLERAFESDGRTVVRVLNWRALDRFARRTLDRVRRNDAALDAALAAVRTAALDTLTE